MVVDEAPSPVSILPIGIDALVSGAVETARLELDDRRAFEAEITDLRESRVRSFLHDVKSRLSDERDVALIFRQMHLLRRANGHEVPRNIALMFFSDDPDLWFRGARVEVVELPDDAGGNLGRIRHRLGRPRSDVVTALKKAIELAPQEKRFRQELERREAPSRSRRETP